MRVSLVVPATTANKEANKRSVLEDLARALSNNPDLIVLPETVLTGYQDTGVFEQDHRLCETIDSAFMLSVRDIARQSETLISLGIFEAQDTAIYDSSVIFGCDGEIVQHYRRVDAHWRQAHYDPEVYRCGTDIVANATPFGPVCTLICGDLFNDSVFFRVKAEQPKFLLVPLAASPEEGYTWMGAVRGYYAQRLKEVEAYAFMVNLCETGNGWPSNDEGRPNGEGDRIGGAHIFGPGGELLATLEPGDSGILTYDMPEVGQFCT